jgi:hypothetical protein
MYGYAPSGFIDFSPWEMPQDGFHDCPVTSSMRPMDHEDYSLSFVPTRTMQDMSAEEFHRRFIESSHDRSMRRTPSPTSTSSGNKYRISKPTSPKNRRVGPTLSPAALASLEFASNNMSPTFLSYQNSPDPELFLDADVAAEPFGPLLSTDALNMSRDLSSMHINPAQITQMRLDTEAALAVRSPCATWDSFSSPVSRTSSPDGGWATSNLASPPQDHASPLLVAKMSPTTAALSLDDELNASYLAMMSADDMQSRRSTLSDGESARDHPYYKMAAPGPDGLYHCPFEGDPSCNHKPEKLKCNYDKFVDSHLKPYRCKNGSCGDARFSSTACLLRHEREAHAMHGHGDKPFLCSHDGCDRAIPGNGFPRQWNLRDHMKRVHHTSPPPMSATVGHTLQAVKARKRRSEGSDAATPARKASNKSAAADAAAKAAKALNNEWRERHSMLSELVPQLSSPDDEHVIDHIEQVRRHLDNLERLHSNRRAMSA